jgi:hypothetical protein
MSLRSKPPERLQQKNFVLRLKQAARHIMGLAAYLQVENL